MAVFCKEDVPLDYQFFVGAVTYLLKRIEPDPINGIPDDSFERSFKQKGHPNCREVRKHAEWLLRMTQRCCFSLTSFLGALIYIERLRRQNKLALYESTWRSTWVAMSVISEKRWEDNYIHPGHIHNTYGSKHTAMEHQKMQVKLFKLLNFELAIDLGEFSQWVAKLRHDEKDPQVISVCHFQRVFIPRPIPNLKTKKSQNTPSTSANSEMDSDSQVERRDLKPSISHKQYDALKANDAHRSHLSFTKDQRSGFATPRAHGGGSMVRHAMQHGAATCRREYHAQSSTSQLNCDWAPQYAPELRPGVYARDYGTGSARHGPDHSHIDLRFTELRMQDLSLRTSCLHNASINADHHLLSMYQQRHRIATQHRPTAMGASAYDQMPSQPWTTRGYPYDQYPRPGVVAWS